MPIQYLGGDHDALLDTAKTAGKTVTEWQPLGWLIAPRQVAIFATVLDFVVLWRCHFLKVEALDAGCLVTFRAIATFQLIAFDGQVAVATANAIFRRYHEQ